MGFAVRVGDKEQRCGDSIFFLFALFPVIRPASGSLGVAVSPGGQHCDFLSAMQKEKKKKKKLQGMVSKSTIKLSIKIWLA